MIGAETAPKGGWGYCSLQDNRESNKYSKPFEIVICFKRCAKQSNKNIVSQNPHPAFHMPLKCHLISRIPSSLCFDIPETSNYIFHAWSVMVISVSLKYISTNPEGVLVLSLSKPSSALVSTALTCFASSGSYLDSCFFPRLVST